MWLLDIFKIKEFKSKICDLESQVKEYKKTIFSLQKHVEEDNEKIYEIKKLLSSEQKDVLTFREELKYLAKRKAEFSEEIKKKQSEIEKSKENLNTILKEIYKNKKNLIEVKDEILVQEFGLYNPKYDFTKVEQYKAKLHKIRQQQRNMVKEGTAVHGNTNWTVNDSRSKGKKMIKDMTKLLLRAFNSECDEIVRKVKYNNFERSAKRISTSYEAISKLGQMMDLYIEKPYYDSKIDELSLALEYQIKKHEEKELQRELREQMREEAKLQKEIEREKEKIKKEERHYKNFLKDIKTRLEGKLSEKERKELLSRKEKANKKLSEIEKSYVEVDYREANKKAGYVYVISNIGSFGENVYKIGMTRRLVPEERVDELGDSSVPFDFDIHAMIFSEDAPKLEKALHKAFENKKVNMVNKRREFFYVTLEEIKSVVKANFDKMAEFIDVADAEEYRISKKMKNKDN